MKYEIGDWVVVRGWDEMVREFGTLGGDIDTPNYYFVNSMRVYCNNAFKIKLLQSDGSILLEGCTRNSFTSEMLRPFDMEVDLMVGDTVKRITTPDWSFHGKRGSMYTVKTIFTYALQLEELDAARCDLSAFEFAGRPEKIKVLKFGYKCLTNDVVAFVTAGLYNLGYKIGRTNIWSASSSVLVIDKDAMTFSFEVEDSMTTMYANLTDFILKAVKKEKPKHYKDKFIPAMKELVKEYMDGTHTFNSNTCSLCKVVQEIVNTNSNKTKDCSICPWLVLTGKRCTAQKDNLKRASELLEWIKKYEEFND